MTRDTACATGAQAPLTPALTANTAPPAAALPVLPSHVLLGVHQAVEIEHNGQRYRLQTTKAGKLILTK